MSSAIQRTVCASISEAAGDSTHAPTFGLSAAARKSPRMPIGRGRRGDVAEEARVAVEERMICDQPRRRLVEQRFGVVAVFGERPVELERGANRATGDSSRVTGRSGIDSSSVGDPIDEAVAEGPEVVGAECYRSVSLLHAKSQPPTPNSQSE